MVRDKIEMGVLKPFLSDPYIGDITCSGVGPSLHRAQNL